MFRSFRGRPVIPAGRLGLFHHRTAEETRRPEDDDANHDRVGHAVAVGRGNVAGAQGLGNAEHHTAEHGPGHRADAAEHRRRKGLDPGQITHGRVHGVVIDGHHDAGHGTHGRTDGEGEGNDPVDIHAHERGRGPVLGQGPHGRAHPGLGDDAIEADHEQDGHGVDGQLHPGDGHRGEGQGRPVEKGRQNLLRKRQRPAAPDDHGQVLQEDRHADGGDERGEPGRLAKGAVGDDVEQHADAGRGHDRQQHGHGQRQAHADKGHGEKRPEHVNLAMGEIDQFDDAVNHGVAHGDQGVDQPQGESVDELLFKQSWLRSRRRARLPEAQTGWKKSPACLRDTFPVPPSLLHLLGGRDEFAVLDDFDEGRLQAVARGIEVVVAGNALVPLFRGGEAGQIVADLGPVRTDLGNGLGQKTGGVVGVGAHPVQIALVADLEGLDEFLGHRTGGFGQKRRREIGIVRGLATELDVVGVVKTVGAELGHIEAELHGLVGDQGAFLIVAGDKKGLGLGGLELGQLGRVVLVALLVGFLAHHGQTEFLGFLHERGLEPDAVVVVFVKDCDLFKPHDLVDVVGQELALEVVAVHVAERPDLAVLVLVLVGDGHTGGRGGDGRDALAHIGGQARQMGRGAQVANDAHNLGIVHDGSGNRGRFARLALVIEKDDFEFLAVDTAGGVDLVHLHGHAGLDVVAVAGGTAREGGRRGNLDGAVGQSRTGHQAHGQAQGGQQHNRSHKSPSPHGASSRSASVPAGPPSCRRYDAKARTDPVPPHSGNIHQNVMKGNRAGPTARPTVR